MALLLNPSLQPIAVQQYYDDAVNTAGEDLGTVFPNIDGRLVIYKVYLRVDGDETHSVTFKNGGGTVIYATLHSGTAVYDTPATQILPSPYHPCGVEIGTFGALDGVDVEVIRIEGTGSGNRELIIDYAII